MGIPVPAYFDTLSEQDSEVWISLYVFFKIIMSQGGQFNGQNLAGSISIYDYLVDLTMDDQTRLELIVDQINSLSANPNPLPYTIDPDLILEEVEGYVMCTHCQIGFYTMNIIP